MLLLRSKSKAEWETEIAEQRKGTIKQAQPSVAALQEWAI